MVHFVAVKADLQRTLRVDDPAGNKPRQSTVFSFSHSTLSLDSNSVSDGGVTDNIRDVGLVASFTKCRMRRCTLQSEPPLTNGLLEEDVQLPARAPPTEL